MLVKLKYLFCIILIIPLFSFFDGNNTIKKNTKVVVIDAGHGGKDSGAMGRHGKEKDIVLKIALKVGKYIEENLGNVEVIYTRKNDTFIELHKRAEIANSENADLFISIHVNSNPNKKPYGTETYAMGLHKTKGNLDVAKKENSVIMIEEDYSTKYEGFDPNSTESYIIFSLMQNVYLEQSLEFASHVQDQFENRAKRNNRGVKQAGFLVLWKTTMPSVLVEAGFISNELEEKYLMSESGQDYLASAIYRAVKDFFKDNEEVSVSDLSLNDTSATVKIDYLIKEDIDTNQIDIENRIKFCIQIASSSKPLIEPNKYFKDFEVKEYKINNSYKYTVNENYNYIKVKNSLADVRQKYPDAFIISFEGGKKISLKKALEKIK